MRDGKERDAFYNGVNLNVNARMRNGLFVSLGTQTGRRIEDRCHVVVNFNNAAQRSEPARLPATSIRGRRRCAGSAATPFRRWMWS